MIFFSFAESATVISLNGDLDENYEENVRITKEQSLPPLRILLHTYVHKETHQCTRLVTMLLEHSERVIFLGIFQVSCDVDPPFTLSEGLVNIAKVAFISVTKGQEIWAVFRLKDNTCILRTYADKDWNPLRDEAPEDQKLSTQQCRQKLGALFTLEPLKPQPLSKKTVKDLKFESRLNKVKILIASQHGGKYPVSSEAEARKKSETEQQMYTLPPQPISTRIIKSKKVISQSDNSALVQKFKPTPISPSPPESQNLPLQPLEDDKPPLKRNSVRSKPSSSKPQPLTPPAKISQTSPAIRPNSLKPKFLLQNDKSERMQSPKLLSQNIPPSSDLPSQPLGSSAKTPSTTTKPIKPGDQKLDKMKGTPSPTPLPVSIPTSSQPPSPSTSQEKVATQSIPISPQSSTNVPQSPSLSINQPPEQKKITTTEGDTTLVEKTSDPSAKTDSSVVQDLPSPPASNTNSGGILGQIQSSVAELLKQKEKAGSATPVSSVDKNSQVTQPNDPTIKKDSPGLFSIITNGFTSLLKPKEESDSSLKKTETQDSQQTAQVQTVTQQTSEPPKKKWWIF